MKWKNQLEVHITVLYAHQFRTLSNNCSPCRHKDLTEVQKGTKIVAKLKHFVNIFKVNKSAYFHTYCFLNAQNRNHDPR
jgi:hypothetical protein